MCVGVRLFVCCVDIYIHVMKILPEYSRRTYIYILYINNTQHTNIYVCAYVHLCVVIAMYIHTCNVDPAGIE